MKTLLIRQFGKSSRVIPLDETRFNFESFECPIKMNDDRYPSFPSTAAVADTVGPTFSEKRFRNSAVARGVNYGLRRASAKTGLSFS